MSQELQTSLSVLGIGVAIILTLLLVAVFSQRVGERFRAKDGLPEAVRAKVVAKRTFVGRDEQDDPIRSISSPLSCTAASASKWRSPVRTSA